MNQTGRNGNFPINSDLALECTTTTTTAARKCLVKVEMLRYIQDFPFRSLFLFFLSFLSPPRTILPNSREWGEKTLVSQPENHFKFEILCLFIWLSRSCVCGKTLTRCNIPMSITVVFIRIRLPTFPAQILICLNGTFNSSIRWIFSIKMSPRTHRNTTWSAKQLKKKPSNFWQFYPLASISKKCLLIFTSDDKIRKMSVS